MYFELKENKPHGTKDDPFSTYHIKNKGRSFQIPVHWHDELEIIYVKSGFLTVSISGESYIGKAGDAFVVSPGSLHLMGSQTGTVDYFTFLFPLKYISFFTDDMFSRLQCLYGKRPVKMVRRCDQNHVNIRRREEFLV